MNEKKLLKVIHPLDYAKARGKTFEIYQYPSVDVLSSVPITGKPRIDLVGRSLVFCVELEDVCINGLDAVTLGRDGALMFHHLCSWHYNQQGILAQNAGWINELSRKGFSENDELSVGYVDDECVYTGGSPVLNFGHLFWQGLSRICVGLQGVYTRELPIAIPDNLPERWLGFFTKMGYGADRRITYPVDRPVHFRKVWLPSLPFYRGNVNDSIPYIWDKAVFLMKDRLTYKTSNLGTGPRKKLALLRRNARFRRIINFDEVSSMLHNHGFIEIEPADFTVEEQIELFSECQCIVYAAGASSPLPLFMPAGGSLIELLPKGVAFVVGGSPTYSWFTRNPHQRIFGEASFLEDNPSRPLAGADPLYNRDKDFIVPIDELRGVLEAVEGFGLTPKSWVSEPRRSFKTGR